MSNSSICIFLFKKTPRKLGKSQTKLFGTNLKIIIVIMIITNVDLFIYFLFSPTTPNHRHYSSRVTTTGQPTKIEFTLTPPPRLCRACFFRFFTTDAVFFSSQINAFAISIWCYRFVSFPVSVSSLCFHVLFSHFVAKDFPFLILFFLRCCKTPHPCCGAALIEVFRPGLIRCTNNCCMMNASAPPLESPLGCLLQTPSVLVSRVAFCLSSVDVWGFRRVQRRTHSLLRQICREMNQTCGWRPKKLKLF